MSPYVRRHPRQPLALPAVLVIGGRRRCATLVDLSRGGAGLRAPDGTAGLATSDEVRIRIDLPPGGPLEVRGRLVRVHFDGGVRYGVSFERVSADTRERIEAVTLPSQSAGSPPETRSRTILAQSRRLSRETRELRDSSRRIREDLRQRLRVPGASPLLMDDLEGRREVLAAVVHELRRPITTVLGWASLLRERKLDPEKTTRALVSIEDAARDLDRRTGDLFDLSRLVLGRLTLERKPVDVRSLLRRTVHAAEPAARLKHQRLSVVLDRPAGPVLADPDRLGQAVGNLLSNAVKFTPEHGRIRVRLADERGRGCRIVVSDTGIGIPAPLLGRLFRPFARGHAGYPGLGLGLSLARSVCELHGGSLEAASAGQGRGATFTIRLPYAPPS
ncbi:MAG TPA: ATP-binding protein, partial [Planctomycetota bacterium]|nr:ATP-binding protein [Planctomycetota bacterium]